MIRRPVRRGGAGRRRGEGREVRPYPLGRAVAVGSVDAEGGRAQEIQETSVCVQLQLACLVVLCFVGCRPLDVLHGMRCARCMCFLMELIYSIVATWLTSIYINIYIICVYVSITK